MPFVLEVQILASRREIPLDALRLERMASGHLCLNLSERVSWERFDAYAKELMNKLGGTRLRVVAESVEMKIWEVAIRGQPLSLVFSDYPAMVSLESSGDAGDAVLQDVHSVLDAPTT